MDLGWYIDALNDACSHDTCDVLAVEAGLDDGVTAHDLKKFLRRKAARKRYLTNARKEFDKWAQHRTEPVPNESFEVWVGALENAGWLAR